VNTPKLLLLSGIGPQEDLSKHGISIVQNMPGVGQNLQDHCQLRLSTILNPGLSDRRSKMETNPEILSEAREQWLKDQSGLLTVYTSSLVAGFLKLPMLESSDEFELLDQRTKDYVLSKGVPHFEIISVGSLFPVFQKRHAKELFVSRVVDSVLRARMVLMSI
jgi:choline dehydrogenase-like flavoprotein